MTDFAEAWSKFAEVSFLSLVAVQEEEVKLTSLYHDNRLCLSLVVHNSGKKENRRRDCAVQTSYYR